MVGRADRRYASTRAGDAGVELIVDERVVHQPGTRGFAKQIDQGKGHDPILLAPAVAPMDFKTMQPLAVKMVYGKNGELRSLDRDRAGRQIMTTSRIIVLLRKGVQNGWELG